MQLKLVGGGGGAGGGGVWNEMEIRGSHWRNQGNCISPRGEWISHLGKRERFPQNSSEFPKIYNSLSRIMCNPHFQRYMYWSQNRPNSQRRCTLVKLYWKLHSKLGNQGDSVGKLGDCVSPIIPHIGEKWGKTVSQKIPSGEFVRKRWEKWKGKERDFRFQLHSILDVLGVCQHLLLVRGRFVECVGSTLCVYIYLLDKLDMYNLFTHQKAARYTQSVLDKRQTRA